MGLIICSNQQSIINIIEKIKFVFALQNQMLSEWFDKVLTTQVDLFNFFENSGFPNLSLSHKLKS